MTLVDTRLEGMGVALAPGEAGCSEQPCDITQALFSSLSEPPST